MTDKKIQPGRSIDCWIKRAPPALVPILERLRSMILDLPVELEERIKWPPRLTVSTRSTSSALAGTSTTPACNSGSAPTCQIPQGSLKAPARTFGTLNFLSIRPPIGMPYRKSCLHLFLFSRWIPASPYSLLVARCCHALANWRLGIHPGHLVTPLHSYCSRKQS